MCRNLRAKDPLILFHPQEENGQFEGAILKFIIFMSFTTFYKIRNLQGLDL